MIHYHGTPIGGKSAEVSQFVKGRHCLVSYAHQDDLSVVMDCSATFVLDNGAFSAWKQGVKMNVSGYMDWVAEIQFHPGFDWCLIPDVIDGDEKQNNRLIDLWLDSGLRCGVPVWHMHESFDRLMNLFDEFDRVALGSSGSWSTIGTVGWWSRMAETMQYACDEFGRPLRKLHGLRMLDPDVFGRLPLSSADSCNAAINSGSVARFGIYKPPSRAQRAAIIADRIESSNSAPMWVKSSQQELVLCG